MKRFSTPIMRGSFLAMLVGLATLITSLIVWTQQSRYNRVYYSEDHYGWVWEERPDALQREPKWSITTKCVQPYLQRNVEVADKHLSAHLAVEPPKVSAVDSMAAWKRRSDWEMQRFNLDFDLKQAKEAASKSHGTSVRQGEVREWAGISWNMPALSPLGYPVERKDTRTDDQKFHDALLSKLDITSFPQHQREEIFQNCVTQETVSYVFLRTTHHSELDDWPEDHPIPFALGMLLVVGGFFGSIGHGFSVAVWNGTGARLIGWVRTGDTASPQPPSAPLAVLQGMMTDAGGVAVTTEPTAASQAEASTPPASTPRQGSSAGRFVPHIVILGGPLALLAFAMATNSSALGRLFGGVVGSAADPINLILALILGASIRRHPMLIGALVALGVGMAILVSKLNAEWGVRLTGDMIAAKIGASLIIGYVANLIRTLASSKTNNTPPGA